jgi:hypothetical protein
VKEYEMGRTCSTREVLVVKSGGKHKDDLDIGDVNIKTDLRIIGEGA